ncbi:hypothetical protein GCM10027084_16670 [Pseudoxanthomonas sangjuensis]|uniref:hypothetical protein n=1 Tax=Pseudoxanthomonas sangjuensis TaxID=1503750 RepID=UPI0013910D43|nr:hypothetical protein [Pseudoxanthomonas sangjuensis]KAF1709698.1 hypothetical protein CSC71_10670 [Pseudoxanthomonas sangjuensis]
MNRERSAASAVHLRIGRLLVDADVLPNGIAPGDLQARLQEALAMRFAESGFAGRDVSGWLDATAGAIETRVRDALPGTAT